jgi:hypothetical protein
MTVSGLWSARHPSASAAQPASRGAVVRVVC